MNEKNWNHEIWVILISVLVDRTGKGGSGKLNSWVDYSGRRSGISFGSVLMEVSRSF